VPDYNYYDYNYYDYNYYVYNYYVYNYYVYNYYVYNYDYCRANYYDYNYYNYYVYNYYVYNYDYDDFAPVLFLRHHHGSRGMHKRKHNNYMRLGHVDVVRRRFRDGSSLRKSGSRGLCRDYGLLLRRKHADARSDWRHGVV
jgi:hypothetical protein